MSKSQEEGGHFMMLKNVERNLVNRIERIKDNHITDPAILKWALDLTLQDLRKHMYDPENPESTDNSLGQCPKCHHRLPRTPVSHHLSTG